MFAIDVDEIEAEVSGDFCCAVEVFDDAVDFAVGEEWIAGVEFEAAIEDRVAIENFGFGLVGGIGAAVAA